MGHLRNQRDASRSPSAFPKGHGHPKRNENPTSPLFLCPLQGNPVGPTAATTATTPPPPPVALRRIASLQHRQLRGAVLRQQRLRGKNPRARRRRPSGPSGSKRLPRTGRGQLGFGKGLGESFKETRGDGGILRLVIRSFPTGEPGELRTRPNPAQASTNCYSFPRAHEQPRHGKVVGQLTVGVALAKWATPPFQSLLLAAGLRLWGKKKQGLHASMFLVNGKGHVDSCPGTSGV